MAKGNRCPSCGEDTFHKSKTHPAVYECATCDAVGWWQTPGGPGGGSGARCKGCGGRTLHTVYSSPGRTVRFCSTCKATVLLL